MSGRSPLDRAIDFAFGVPIAATAFAREATRFALRSVVSAPEPHPPTDRGDVAVTAAEPPRGATKVEGSGEDSTEDLPGSADPCAVDAILLGYDSMGAREILALIENLDDGSLAVVEDYEQRNRSRRTVLVRIAALRQSASA